MTHIRKAKWARDAAPVDALFDGPLGSFLEVVVRFEQGLARMLAPLARGAREVDGGPRLQPIPPVAPGLEAA